jgi:hypothetical protein
VPSVCCKGTTTSMTPFAQFTNKLGAESRRIDTNSERFPGFLWFNVPAYGRHGSHVDEDKSVLNSSEEMGSFFLQGNGFE